MKIYTNQTNIYNGSTAVMEHKDKDQADGLEIAQSFILCRQHAYMAHINSIDIFIHNDCRAEVVKGRFMDKGSDIDITDLIRHVFHSGQVLHEYEERLITQA